MNYKFKFICGDDDFLVKEKAKLWYNKYTKETKEDLSKEIIDGRADKIEDVKNIIIGFGESVQTKSLFLEKKVIWLKGINFISNTIIGNSKLTLDLLENLKVLLNNLNNDVTILVSASPVHKAKNFYKWCLNESDYEIVNSSSASLTEKIKGEFIDLGLKASDSAIQLLINKVNSESRVLSMEVEKIALFSDCIDSVIDEKLINQLVPNFGEGDFFEVTEAFFSNDLNWTLDAIKRHFYNNTDFRPLLGSLQSRNRMMIQLKILYSSGELKKNQKIDKNRLDRIWEIYKHHFNSLSDKSNLNVFTQNPYYLLRLSKDINNFSLKALVDIQIEFSNTFEAGTSNYKNQEVVFNNLAIKCLNN